MKLGPKKSKRLFKEWKAGTRVSEIAGREEIPRGTLRRLFREMAGGTKAYSNIMSQFEPVGRQKGEKQGPRSKPDDRGVRWLRSKAQKKRWKGGRYITSHQESLETFTDPYNGEIFIKAPDDYCPADLIVPSDIKGLGDLRLVRFYELEEELKKKEEQAEAARKKRKAKTAKRKGKRTKKIRRKR